MESPGLPDFGRRICSAYRLRTLPPDQPPSYNCVTYCAGRRPGSFRIGRRSESPRLPGKFKQSAKSCLCSCGVAGVDRIASISDRVNLRERFASSKAEYRCPEAPLDNTRCERCSLVSCLSNSGVERFSNPVELPSGLRVCNHLTGILLLLVASVCLISTPLTLTAQEKPQPLTRQERKEAERRLSDIGYRTGPVDGLLDPASQSALIAFQKWEGRAITGQLTLDELNAIRASSGPHARETGYEHVEVDLDRQVLLLINENDGVRVFPVSTGSGQPFIDEGQQSVAYTPRGRFIVYEKVMGWEKGPLGSLYYPNYISGGVAIHGSRNVPIQPVSHGCIRLPVFAAREVSKALTLGTIVLVYDKLSFVSAKDWVKNPKLKPTADIE